MAETMVERVKEAIAEKFAPAIDFRAPYAKVMLDMAARAAIEAMREPTEEMRRAGREQILSRRASELSVVHIFTAMIDAILKEGDEQATREP